MIIFSVWKLIVWISSISAAFPLSQLVITGERIYTTDSDVIRAVLSTGPVGTFMTQDIRIIQKKIKSFPWIKQVSVRKQWPDKIKIYIVEYIPVANWKYLYMITKDLVFFTIPKGYVHKKSFPILFGPEGSVKDILFHYYMFNEVLQSFSFKIKSISVNHRFSWEIILQDNVKLILGRKNNIERLQRFIKIYPIYLTKYLNKEYEYISYIDLRYKSGFSVRKCELLDTKIN